MWSASSSAYAMLDASAATHAPRPGRKARLIARLTARPTNQIAIAARGKPRPAKCCERIVSIPRQKIPGSSQ
jgi:hypothetical protein